MVKEKGLQIRKEGTWNEISEFCNDITEILIDIEEVDNSSSDINDWKDWIPRKDEEEEKLDNRTVEHASYGEAYEEEPGGDIDEEFEDAKEDVDNIKDDLSNSNFKSSYESFMSFLNDLYSTVRTFFFNKLNRLEKFVYSNIMTRDGKYFDTELISAQVEGVSDVTMEENEDRYVILISFRDSELKDKVMEELEQKT
jgi:hypothetical protein